MLSCLIRKFSDQWLFAPTRNLSQLITSFIASQSQGIHRSLLFAFFILLVCQQVSTCRYLFLLVSLAFLTSRNLSLQKIFFTTLSLFLSICQRSFHQCIIHNAECIIYYEFSRTCSLIVRCPEVFHHFKTFFNMFFLLYFFF
jgi:hypothetical protein